MMTDLKTLRRDSEMSGGIELPKVPHTSGASGLSTNENEPWRCGYRSNSEACCFDNGWEISDVNRWDRKAQEQIQERNNWAIVILLKGSSGYFWYLNLKPKRLSETTFNRSPLETQNARRKTVRSRSRTCRARTCRGCWKTDQVAGWQCYFAHRWGWSG